VVGVEQRHQMTDTREFELIVPFEDGATAPTGGLGFERLAGDAQSEQS